MKLERSKNAARNIKVGILYNSINIILPFMLRTILIHTVGVEYLGLNGLFSSILSVLSLAELGFGSAMVFYMYRAIANDDTHQINALLYAYRKVYHIIGIIILLIGIALIPFLPKLIHGSYPADIHPVVVYLLYLVNTVTSYFMFAYRGSLLTAFQRNDIVSSIHLAIQFGQYLTQAVLLLTFKNYYVYLIVIPIFTILSNCCIAVVSKRMFPQFYPKGDLNPELRKDIKSRVGGLMLSKVCQASRNSFDNIFMSIYVGLSSIAVYNNYFYVMNSVSKMLGISVGAVAAGIGNSFFSESEEKNHRDMMRMYFVYMWTAGWCSICLLCLYQPFMKIWTGEQLLFPFSSVVLICSYFYLLKIGDLRGSYAAAAGLWNYEKGPIVLELILNISLNGFLGRAWGVNGIISSTLISMFLVNFCWKTQITYRHCFPHHSVSTYYLFHLKSASITAIIAIPTFLLCEMIPDGLLFLSLKLAICLVLPNILYYLIYHNTCAYQEAVPWVLDRIVKRRKNNLK